MIHEYKVDEIEFVSNLNSDVIVSAQGTTEGPITAFLMFIQPSKFAALQSKIYFFAYDFIFRVIITKYVV